MEDLSASDYRDLAKKFLPSVGLRAQLWTHLETEDSSYLWAVALYPHGIGSDSRGYLRVTAKSLSDVWEKLQAAWVEHKERHRTEVTRKMALAIIRLTTELGECTDAALRQEFDPSEIASYGSDACDEANAMARRGPFTIATRGGANAESAA